MAWLGWIIVSVFIAAVVVGFFWLMVVDIGWKAALGVVSFFAAVGLFFFGIALIVGG